MKHRTFAPAIGALAALVVAAGVPSYASAADPSGIWAKDDGSAKMEVKKCGRGICSKIVWLRDPNDSRGRPLHDARNENASMRDRPIIGLALFSNMVAIDSSTWQGSVYNPEEGKIYTDVKVTLASRNQIVLKGCKAWLLCGEKYWTRSKLPPTVAEPEPIEVKAPAEPVEPAAPDGQTPIEAKATQPPPKDMAPKAPMDMASKAPMDMAPKSMPKPAPIVEAAREPIAEPPAPKPIAAPLAVATPSSEATTVEARVSVAPPKQRLTSPAGSQHNAVGLGLVTAPVNHPDPMPLTGENVSSMMEITKPAPVASTPAPEAAQPEVNEESVQSAAIEEEEAAPAPKPKAKPKPKAQSADASAGPATAAPVAVKPKPKVKPKEPEEVLPWLRPRY
jgi:uncharacterized protein (DUF2147 family)